MKSIRCVLFFALAVCALRSDAAEIPRSADKVDLRLFVENGAAIAKNMFKAVNTGLDQSKPNMDKILNELAPEAKTMIRRIIDVTRGIIYVEEKRVNHVFTTLNKTLDNLKPIKTCSDKVSPNAKKLALATEKEIVKIVETVKAKHKKEIDNIKLGIKKTLDKARTLFDNEVDAVVKCLTPGRKDATNCLNTELDKIAKGVNTFLVESFILLQTATETVSNILPEVLEKVLPVLNKLVTEGKTLLKVLGDCVAALK